MSTKKASGDSFAAIFILLISQLIAQGIATAFGLIKVPSGVCNIIAGALYVLHPSMQSGLLLPKRSWLPVFPIGVPSALV